MIHESKEMKKKNRFKFTSRKIRERERERKGNRENLNYVIEDKRGREGGRERE